MSIDPSTTRFPLTRLSRRNRNFLSPIGFKFNIGKMKGVDFFCQAALSLL